MKNTFQNGSVDEVCMNGAIGEDTSRRAFRYLFSLQNHDGGWGPSKDEPSTIHMTAIALLSLRLCPGKEDTAAAVDKAAGYLLAGQHKDGGFGDVFSTVPETALAYHALQGVAGDHEALNRARHYLVLSQFENGSWNDDLYTTTLALGACNRPGNLMDSRSLAVEPAADVPDEDPAPPGAEGDRAASDGLSKTMEERVVVQADNDRVAATRGQMERNERTKISLVSRRNASSSSPSDPSSEIPAAGRTVVVQSVTTDKKKYGSNETVYIYSTIENRSQVVFSVVVNAQLADARGQILDVASHDTGPTVNLDAGACEPVTLLWNTGMNQPGSYGIRFHVADAANGSILDEKKITLAIAPVIGIDDLSLSLTPSQLTADENKTIELRASFQNRSNTDASMRAEFSAKDPQGEVVHNGAIDFELPSSTLNTTLELPPFTHTFDRCGQYLIEASILAGDLLCSNARSAIKVAPATRIEAVKRLDPATITPDGQKRVRVGIRLEGIGATVNPSFMSAMTNSTGDRISIVFDKAMADPAGKHARFSVTADRVSLHVMDVRLERPDITRMDLYLAGPVGKDQALLVSCDARELTCAEGKELMSFHDEPVVNRVSHPIFNQDGYGFSGQIAPNPLSAKTVMTGYGDWPKGFYKNVLAFAGAVFDGRSLWMVPANADSVVKVDRQTGEMTAFNRWPEEFRKGNLAFAGAVFDGRSIWMVPANADSVVKVDTESGEMTRFNRWPEGFAKGGHAFAGAVFDGRSIWMVPSYADSVVRLDTESGKMTRFNRWPEGFAKGGYAFAGGVFDGRSLWMVPANADSVVKLDTLSGEMTRYNQWPEGLGKVEYAFAGGVFDGRYVWMVPYYSDRVVRIDTDTGEMTGHHRRPDGLGKVEYAFAGGVFDGQSIWMVPLNSDRVVRIDKDTTDVMEHTGWPQGFTKGVNAFAGGVFDGECVWLVPSYADRVVRISSFSSLSVSADITANDSFYLYVSQDDSEEGTLAGQGKGWSSVHNLNAALVPGITNYLHVRCVDTSGPVAGFIADFTLNDGNFHFADGSQHIVTSEENWRVFTDRFGGDEGSVTAIGRNGVGSWSTRFGIDLDANWIWTRRGTDRGARFFSTPIYYSPVVVAPMEDVRITDTVAGPDITVDEGSFTRKPSIMERRGDTTIAEWCFDKFRIGQREDFFFDVMVRDTIPGEDRLVSHSLKLSYKDASRTIVEKEFGPSHVHVLSSSFTSSVDTARRVYRMGEDVNIFCSIRNLSDLEKTLDIRVIMEDLQGVLIEESFLEGVRFAPGQDRNIDDLVFKLVATNEGTHRVRLLLREDLREAGEASADFTVEDIPAEGVPVYRGRANDGEQPDIAAEGPGTPAGNHSLRLARDIDTSLVKDVPAEGLDGLEGTINAQPSPIYQGLSETIYYTVSKGTRQDLAGLRVNVVIVNPETGEARQSFAAPRAHLTGDGFAGSFTFSTGTLEPREYTACLKVSDDSDSEPRQISTTTFVVRRIEVVVT